MLTPVFLVRNTTLVRFPKYTYRCTAKNSDSQISFFLEQVQHEVFSRISTYAYISNSRIKRWHYEKFQKLLKEVISFVLNFLKFCSFVLPISGRDRKRNAVKIETANCYSEAIF